MCSSDFYVYYKYGICHRSTPKKSTDIIRTRLLQNFLFKQQRLIEPVKEKIIRKLHYEIKICFIYILPVFRFNDIQV